jgi:hypothetical protein
MIFKLAVCESLGCSLSFYCAYAIFILNVHIQLQIIVCYFPLELHGSQWNCFLIFFPFFNFQVLLS